MIRAATQNDLGALLDMGRAFHEEAGHEQAHDFCTFDPESFTRTLGALAAANLLLVTEEGGEPVGMAGADVGRAIYNYDVLLGRECFWYFRPAFRKGLGRQLLGALEETARGSGARLFDVVAEDGKRSAPLARLYRAGAYSPAEVTFRKRL